MLHRWYILTLVLVLTAVAATIGVVAIVLLYRTATAVEAETLRDIVRHQARLMEACAAKGDGEAGIIARFREAFAHDGASATTSELAVARRVGDDMAYILIHNPSQGGPLPVVPWSVSRGEPMRRALSGASGICVESDYRGQTVLAAYEPVAGLGWGAVAKMDLAQIRAPFLRAGLIIAACAVAVIAGGAWLIIRVTRPVMRELTVSRESLSESEGRFRALFLSMSEGVAIHSLVRAEDGRVVDYRVLDANPAYFRHTGLDVELVRGRLASAIYGAGAPPYLEQYAAVAQGGAPIAFEVFFPPLAKHFHISVFSPHRDRFVTVFTDISERKLAELSLRRQEEFTRTLLDSLDDGVVACDAEGRLQLFNRTARDWHGMDALSLPPEEWARHYDLYAADGVTPLTTAAIPLLRAFQGETVHDEAMVIAARNQPPRHILASGRVFTDAQGLKLGAVAVMRDVTERRQMAEALRQERDRLDIITSTSPIGILYLDAAGRITYANPRAEWILGLSHDEVLARVYNAPAWHITTFDGRPIPDEELPFRRALAAEQPLFDVENAIVWPDGRRVLLSINLARIQDAQGRIEGVVMSLEDVTGRWQAEALLRRERDNAQRYLDTVEAIIVSLDTAGCVRMINRKGCQVLGYQEAELVGRNWFHLCLPQPVGMDEAYPVFLRLMAGETASVEYVENAIVTRAGTRRHLAWHNSQLRDEQGAIIGVLSAGEDITGRKQAEEAMRESKERLDLALQAAGMGIWSFEVISGRRIFDAQTCRLLGLDPERFQGSAEEFLAVVHPEDRERLQEALQRTIREDAPYEPEYRVLAADGGIRHLTARGRLIRDDGGRPLRVSSILWDITAGTLAAAALLADGRRIASLVHLSERRYDSAKAMLDAAIEEIAAISGSQFAYIYYFDEGKQEFTLHAWSRSVMPACSIPHPPTVYALGSTGIWGEAVRQRRPIIVNDFEAPHPLKKGYPQGHAHLHRFMTVPVFDGGRIVAVAGVANKAEAYTDTDVRQLSQLMDFVWHAVEHRKAEEALRSLNAELERRVAERTSALSAVNRELESFSYSVSHDLRAPIRHIHGFVGLLREHLGEDLDPVARQHCEVIDRAARRMGLLIDSLLQYFRVGREAMHLQDCDCAHLVRDLIAESAQECAGRQVAWEVGALPVVEGDRIMLRQVFANLLGNALKYTRGRERTVIAISAVTSGQQTILTVRDNGAGFDMRFADKLFGVFQRLHSDQEFEGTGIGLAHVQRIVHRHGGSIRGEGEVGAGAAFHVTLPLRQATPA